MKENFTGDFTEDKMKQAVNLGYIRKPYAADAPRTALQAMQMCAEAGFDTLDCTPDVKTDAWEENIAEVVESAAQSGMHIEQSHAPYNRYTKLPLDVYSEYIRRAVIGASRMGCRQIVIHADDYEAPSEGYSAQKALIQMYDFWAPFAELAISHGVDLAIETVFEDRPKQPLSRFSSRANELISMIDRFADPHVVCCWDSGHAHLAFGAKMNDVMRALGSRITCTHIHDNYYGKDLHLMPFAGEIDWAAQMRTLREIGYRGVLTYEFVYGRYPEHLLADFLRQAYRTGEYLIGLYEND